MKLLLCQSLKEIHSKKEHIFKICRGGSGRAGGQRKTRGRVEEDSVRTSRLGWRLISCARGSRVRVTRGVAPSVSAELQHAADGRLYCRRHFALFTPLLIVFLGEDPRTAGRTARRQRSRPSSQGNVLLSDWLVQPGVATHSDLLGGGGRGNNTVEGKKAPGEAVPCV